MRWRSLSWLFLLTAGLLLQACGFHLRGGELLPPQLTTLQVKGDDKSDLYRLVTLRLKRGGVRLVDGGEEVPVLTLGGTAVSNQAATVDSRSQVVEYVMRFSTQYSIKVPDEEPQVFNATFNRTFLNKSSEALSSSREQEQLSKEMQEQTADLILLQLSRVTF